MLQRPLSHFHTKEGVVVSTPPREAVVSFETQVVQSFSPLCPDPSRAQTGAPGVPGLDAPGLEEEVSRPAGPRDRRWGAIVATGMAPRGAEGFAPAAQVGRAVGALVLAAATHGAGAAAYGAAVACAEGVHRTVDLALTRLIVDPPARAHAPPAGAATPGERALSELPAPGWWEREPQGADGAPPWARSPAESEAARSDLDAVWPTIPPARLSALRARPSRRPAPRPPRPGGAQ